jgi:hypothetical protein
VYTGDPNQLILLGWVVADRLKDWSAKDAKDAKKIQNILDVEKPGAWRCSLRSLESKVDRLSAEGAEDTEKRLENLKIIKIIGFPLKTLKRSRDLKMAISQYSAFSASSAD